MNVVALSHRGPDKCKGIIDLSTGTHLSLPDFKHNVAACFKLLLTCLPR